MIISCLNNNTFAKLELNFRDTKQLWGLEDFINVNQTLVTNAANGSLFMIDLSQVLMDESRKIDPNFVVLDLKSNYGGCKYASEILKMLPQKPDDILVAKLFQKVAALGLIHGAKTPILSN